MPTDDGLRNLLNAQEHHRLTDNQIHNLIYSLEHAIERPHMYFSDELPAVAAFLYGFNFALGVLGFKEKYELPLTRVEEERGWHPSNNHISREMLAKGLTTSEISREILTIQKIAWERLLAKRNQSTGKDDSQKAVIFSEKTLTVLASAGWTPDREADMSANFMLLQYEDYPIFPCVKDFLKRFGGLKLVFQNSVQENLTVTHSVHFEIEPALRPMRRVTFEAYSHVLDTPLCPVGIDNEDIVLAMNPEGKVYGIGEKIFFMGNSGEAAIEAYSNWSISSTFPIIG